MEKIIKVKKKAFCLLFVFDRRKMKKYFYIIVRYVPWVIGLYLVLFKFDESIQFIENCIKEIIIFCRTEDMNTVAITFLAVVLIGAIVFKFVKHLWDKLKIEALDFKKNTHSKGNAKWSSNKEIKSKFVMEEYTNHNTIGFIVGRYKEYRFLGRKFIVPFFKVKENKTKEKIKNLDNEIFTNKEQEKILKRNESKAGLKELSLSMLKLKYKDVVIVDSNPVHQLIIGTTRSGKTQTLVLPQIDYYSLLPWSNKPNIVISDPKGELFENTAKSLEKRGYEIKVINLKDFEYSHSWNPLEVINDAHINTIKQYEKRNDEKIYVSISEVEEANIEELENLNIQLKEEGYDEVEIQKREEEKIKMEHKKVILKNLSKVDFSEAEKEILKLSNAIIPEEGNDPTWSQGAQGLLASYIKIVWEESFINNSLDTTFNMFSVVTEINEKAKIVYDKATYMQQELKLRDKSHFAKLNHTKNFEGKNYNSYDQQLRSKLKVFQNKGLGKLSSRNQINFKDIAKGEKPYAIFLITPDYDTTFNFFISTFISQLYVQLVEYAEEYSKGKLKRKCIFLLDEFANIPKIPDLTNKLTVCLGRGIQFIMIVQNIKQLKATYGEDDYVTILDNAHNKLYLLAGDNDTRKWFSEQLGTYTIISKNISGKDYDEMSVSQSEESKDLMSAYELNLNPMGQVIGAITKMNPIKMQLRPAFQFMQNQQTTTKEFFTRSENSNLHSEIENIKEVLL